jgi:hypothetical protein
MELLKEHGFTTREHRIELFLTKAQTLTSDGFYDDLTMVFSRPLLAADEASGAGQQPLLRMDELI